MEFVAAINCAFENHRDATEFLCRNFGFEVVAEDELSITINNGVLSIRIHHSLSNQLSLHLDLEASDYKETIIQYQKLGFVATSDHQNPTKFRVEQNFKGPYGIALTIYQVLSEDDLGILPELKATLDWTEEATVMAQHLLKHVSLNFRELARKKMVQQAESYATIEGTMEVTKEFMVTAFLQTTPAFKQADLQRLLMEYGVSQDFINQQLSIN